MLAETTYFNALCRRDSKPLTKNISEGTAHETSYSLHQQWFLIHKIRLPGVKEPKVAVLSAVEIVKPAIPSTIDAACLAKMADRGQITGAIVDGPLAFDNAISSESAKVKGIKSPVAGDVDILVVPDLVSGNIPGKDLEYLASARLAGLVVGTKVPIILTSRSDPPAARLISCAVATLVSHRMDQGVVS